MAKRKQKTIYLMPEPKWEEIHLCKTDEERLSCVRKFEYFVHYEVPDKKAIATVSSWLEKVPDVWFSSFAKYTFIWSKTGYMTDSARKHLLKKIPALEYKAEEILEK